MQSKQLESEVGKVDWAKAPHGAEFYSNGMFRKNSAFSSLTEFWFNGAWNHSNCTRDDCKQHADYQARQIISLNSKEWSTDERISAIAQNGGDGLHYAQQEAPQPKTSAEFLSACLHVQSQRGKQYDANGAGERSFAAAASAFNAVTGKDLKGSDVCLILEMVKLVRQYSSPDRLHGDSVLDKVSYSALWAEMLTSELQK